MAGATIVDLVIDLVYSLLCKLLKRASAPVFHKKFEKLCISRVLRQITIANAVVNMEVGGIGW